MILSSNLIWLIRSKHCAISASRTYLGFPEITILIASIASCVERPGRNPCEFDSNLASHSGSSASLISACFALSSIVGIPNGRFSFFPGFGIQTLLVALDLPSIFNFRASLTLWLLFSDFIPSTPAVFCRVGLDCYQSSPP